jgi:hypothetical protein
MPGALLWLVVGCVGWGCAGRGAHPVAGSDRARSTSAARLDAAAVLALGSSELDADERALYARALADAAVGPAYVRALLADRRFAAEMAPRIILRGARFTPIASDLVAMRSFELGGERIYHLREPCPRKDAVSVEPWWSPGERVLVCPDSYQPEHLFNTAAGRSCDSAMAGEQGDHYCGCGPQLANCLPGPEQIRLFRQRMLDETVQTVAYAVDHDQPLARIFTATESFRSREVEFLYQRDLLLNGKIAALPDLRAWPAEGRYAPRPELIVGQHAGILTDAQLLRLNDDAIRPRMRVYYDLMWCKEPDSVDVRAEHILALGLTNLREGNGWQRLAAMPICTDCHARLDYGMQFFLGYPSTNVAKIFVPKLVAVGDGPLYVNDIHDQRGEAPLVPRRFAELAVQQPEFRQCMTQSVVDHVFDDRAAPADRSAVSQAFDRRPTLRGLMEAALLRYLAADDSPGTPARPAPAPVVATAAGLAVSPRLVAAVESSCGDCHFPGRRPLLDGDRLTPQTAARMLDSVAFGKMPKGPLGMAPAARRELVSDLIDALWPAGPGRDAAAWFYAGAAEPLAAHRLSSALHVVAQAAGEAGPQLQGSFVEDLISDRYLRYTPNLAAATALEALAGCKASSPDQVRACLERSLAPERVLKP